MRSKPTYKTKLEIINQIKFEEWKREEKTIYSEADIKQFVDDNVSVHTNYCFHDWINEIIKVVKRRCGSVKRFCLVDGKYYFDDIGYNKLIEYFESHEMIRPKK